MVELITVLALIGGSTTLAFFAARKALRSFGGLDYNEVDPRNEEAGHMIKNKNDLYYSIVMLLISGLFVAFHLLTKGA